MSEFLFSKQIPFILFNYARQDYLLRILESLKQNQVPVIYVFIDAPKTPDKELAVQKVCKILHGIDWCEVVICERDVSFKLDRYILKDMTEVLQKHDLSIINWSIQPVGSSHEDFKVNRLLESTTFFEPEKIWASSHCGAV